MWQESLTCSRKGLPVQTQFHENEFREIWDLWENLMGSIIPDKYKSPWKYKSKILLEV